MKIIVTGGAGFIGSHIADAYIKAGHKVAVIDNLRTGFRRNLNPKAKFYQADITDEKKIREIMRKEQPDVVNHHAALAEVVVSMRDPAATYRTNVLGTANVLAAFATESRSKRKKFIFASTGGTLYGEPKKLPASEKASIAPLSAYGLSKHMAEEAIRFHAKSFGLNYLIFRYANVYGPRQNPKGEAGVIAIFGGLLERGKQPVIFGDGKKTRDYVHVSDIARANALALSRGKNTELNLGWSREISDRDVFKACASFFGYKKGPKLAPFRKGEVLRIKLDARKAGKVLDWKPEIDFASGVRSTLETL